MNNKQFQEEINNIVEQIKEKYKPQKIFLFGSAARGDYGENSDVDMLIVKNTSKRRVERIKDVLFNTKYNVPFEPLVYTSSELDKRKKLGDNFILQVLKEGKILYEQN